MLNVHVSTGISKYNENLVDINSLSIQQYVQYVQQISIRLAYLTYIL